MQQNNLNLQRHIKAEIIKTVRQNRDVWTWAKATNQARLHYLKDRFEGVWDMRKIVNLACGQAWEAFVIVIHINEMEARVTVHAAQNSGALNSTPCFKNCSSIEIKEVFCVSSSRKGTAVYCSPLLPEGLSSARYKAMSPTLLSHHVSFCPNSPLCTRTASTSFTSVYSPTCQGGD